MHPVLDNITDLILVATSILIIAFWIIYGTLFSWWKTRPGRAVFLFFGALVGMLVASIAATFAGDYEARPWVRLGLFSYAFGTAIYLFVALVAQWRRTGRVLDLEARARNAQAVLEQTDPEWRRQK